MTTIAPPRQIKINSAVSKLLSSSTSYVIVSGIGVTATVVTGGVTTTPLFATHALSIDIVLMARMAAFVYQVWKPTNSYSLLKVHLVISTSGSTTWF